MDEERTEAPIEQAKKTTKPKSPAKPKRVKMRNMNAGNGTIGGIAQPWEKDVPAWEARGWVRA